MHSCVRSSGNPLPLVTSTRLCTMRYAARARAPKLQTSRSIRCSLDLRLDPPRAIIAKVTQKQVFKIAAACAHASARSRL